MNNLYKNAIVLIYPDGKVESVEIDKEILHMYYYEDLKKKSKRFREFIEKNNIKIGEFIYYLNLELTYAGIIVADNIDIYEIVTDKDYLEKNVPTFSFALPNEITKEQKVSLNDLFNEYNLSNSAYSIYKDYDIFENISYYDLADEVYQKGHHN